MSPAKDPHQRVLGRTLDPETQKNAASYADSHRCSFGQALIDQGAMSEEDIGKALASFYRTEYVPWSEALSVAEVPGNTVGIDYYRTWRFVPLTCDDRELVVLLANPNDLGLQDMARSISEVRNIVYKVGLPETIDRLLESADLPGSAGEEEELPTLAELSGEEDAPVVRFVNMLLLRMNQEKLKELEIPSPDADGELTIRALYDKGEWADLTTPPRRFFSQVVNRLKVMADVDPIASSQGKTGSIRVKARTVELLFDVVFDSKDAGGKTRVVLRS